MGPLKSFHKFFEGVRLSAPKKLDQKSAVAPPACCGCSTHRRRSETQDASNNVVMDAKLSRHCAARPAFSVMKTVDLCFELGGNGHRNLRGSRRPALR